LCSALDKFLDVDGLEHHAVALLAATDINVSELAIMDEAAHLIGCYVELFGSFARRDQLFRHSL
jgi:hypothetical protein